MTKTKTTPDTLAQLADRYGVSQKTITRWRRRGAPLRDIDRLAHWAAAQKRPPAGLLPRLMELRDGEGGNPKSMEPKMGTPDPDWISFCSLAQAQPGDNNTKASLAAVVKAREFASYKLEKANAAGDRSAQRFYTDLLTRLAATVHDREMLAQRLGRDLGETYSGEDIDRLGNALAWWLGVGADTLISQVAKGLSEAPGSLGSREGVRKVVEPLILAEMVLVPLVRATQIDAGCRLPLRLVHAVREGLASILDDGEALFNELYATPPPRPTPPTPAPIGGPNAVPNVDTAPN